MVKLAILVLSATLLLATWAGLQFSVAREPLKHWLAGRLIKATVWSPSQVGPDRITHNVIYVLGGDTESVVKKFSGAAVLYHRGVGSKILLLSRPGLMAYSPRIKRNPSYEEWAVQKLRDLGVRSEDIEFVRVWSGLFGTFSEARRVSQVVSEKGYSRLVLVTSLYHTRRTWESFTHFAEKRKLQVHLYPSDEEAVCLRQLLLESLKLVVYELFLV